VSTQGNQAQRVSRARPNSFRAEEERQNSVTTLSDLLGGKSAMNGQQRSDIRPGKRVEIVLKKDQRTGKRTVGTVKAILTSASFHSRGIQSAAG